MSHKSSEQLVLFYLTSKWKTRAEILAEGIEGFNVDEETGDSLTIMRTLNRLCEQKRTLKEERAFKPTVYKLS